MSTLIYQKKVHYYWIVVFILTSIGVAVFTCFSILPICKKKRKIDKKKDMITMKRNNNLALLEFTRRNKSLVAYYFISQKYRTFWSTSNEGIKSSYISICGKCKDFHQFIDKVGSLPHRL